MHHDLPTTALSMPRRPCVQLARSLVLLVISMALPAVAQQPVASAIQPLPATPPIESSLSALGKRLFFDPRLSGSGAISCASCHKMDQGGADGLARSVGASGKPLARNTPTVFNAGLQFRQFWDGRAKTLEEQVDGPLTAPDEMDGDWPTALMRLRNDSGYRSQFAQVFTDGITEQNVRSAIAAFERTLITPNAPFDRYLLGERSAVSSEQLAGYQRFQEYGCIGCHQGQLVGGNLFQTVGLMAPDRDFPGNEDRGRAAITGEDADLHRFKVPSLRNVVLTAPYFHDGSVETLDEAINLMAELQLGRTIPADDRALIAAFLASLTGDQPKVSP